MRVRLLLWGALAAAALLPARGFAQESVLPPDLCASLPQVTDQSALLDVLRGAPDFFAKTGKNSYRLKVDLREIPDAVAFDIIDDAAQKGWGAVDFVADPGFQGECAFYLRAATLRLIDEAFVVDLTTPLSGVDELGNPFWMKAMILGRRQAALVFEQDHVSYFNARAKRMMAFLRSVRIKVRRTEEGGSPVVYLDDLRGLSVQTGFPFGWENIERIRLAERRLYSWVLGQWRSGEPVVPLTRKQQGGKEPLLVKPFQSSRGLMRTSQSLGALRRLADDPGRW
ncbi:MAG: hypothetical protein ABIJ96_00640 [Elusimicrobiota bacterium]